MTIKALVVDDSAYNRVTIARMLASDSRIEVVATAVNGEDAIKQIKIVELISAAIENGKIKIVPDVLVSGGGNATDGLMGQLTKLLPGVDLSGLANKGS